MGDILAPPRPDKSSRRRAARSLLSDPFVYTPRMHSSFSSVPLVVLALLFGVFLTGCDDAVLSPTLRGGIEGQVLVFDTGAPVSGASITTSPATGAFVTAGNGSFTIPDIESGPYNLSIRKAGFNANTISVAVRDDETTPATIFLERDEDATQVDSLTAEILNWSNRTSGEDSTFVDVESRVENPGSVEIAAYEVYIRIATDDGPFFEEVRGTALQPTQADVAGFSMFLRGRTAQAVTIDDTWFETDATK